MLYFDCFLVAAWTFAFGWFLGTVYAQNQNEKRERPRVSEIPERSPEFQAWRFPSAASIAAD